MNRESRIEAYLRQATRGLWGHKRREVREELELHLHERVTAHRIAGLSESEAEERALAELGAPGIVSAGMTRLYTLPTVVGSSFALMVAALVVVAFWPKGLAQTLEGTAYWPTLECQHVTLTDENLTKVSDCVSVRGMFWVSQKALRRALEPQGVDFEKAGFAAEILKVTVPGSSPFFIEANPRITLLGVGESSRGYLPLWDVIERFSLNPDASVRISSWDNPTISLNDVSFQLRDDKQSIKGREFYWTYLSAITLDWLSQIEDPRTLTLVFPGEFKYLDRLTQRTDLQVDSEPGDVYGMMTYLELPGGADSLSGKPQGEPALWFQLGRVTEAGDVRMWLPRDGTTFADSFSNSDDLNLGQSVLFRLAGSNLQMGGWYEVVSPEQVTPWPH